MSNPHESSQTPLERGLQSFLRGFTFTRSFTHPYQAERVKGVWVMRDGPRKRGDYRSEEWIALHVPPREVDRIARAHTRGRYCICTLCGVDESQEAIRADFRELGYRLCGTEPLFVHELQSIPAFEAPVRIERVRDAELAVRVAKAARARQMLPRHLTEEPASLRQYVALDGQTPVGWVRSIATGDSSWCSNMFVGPDYRRRGIARALLSRMLADDREHGSTLAVLLSSHTGAKLYPLLGYSQIGELLVHTPPR